MRENLRNRSSRRTRGHDWPSLYYVFRWSFLYLKSKFFDLKLRKGSCGRVFQLQCSWLTIWTRNPHRVLNTCSGLLYGAFKQTFRRRCMNYCSLERVMNRVLWSIIGFVHQQSCRVYRSTLRCRTQSAYVQYSGSYEYRFAVVWFIHEIF